MITGQQLAGDVNTGILGLAFKGDLYGMLYHLSNRAYSSQQQYRSLRVWWFSTH